MITLCSERGADYLAKDRLDARRARLADLRARALALEGGGLCGGAAREAERLRVAEAKALERLQFIEGRIARRKELIRLLTRRCSTRA